MSKKTPLPPPYSHIYRHKVLPEVTHDENARMNFIANLNIHIGSILFPGVSKAYKNRIEPEFIEKNGRKPSTSIEVRNIIKKDIIYQTWSAIRRNTMEMRHQIGRSTMRELCAGATTNPDLGARSSRWWYMDAAGGP